jgi:pyruvate dehydrogenase E1 component alpha subunit
VYRAAQTLVGELRAGAGPRLLHARTYRFKGHVSVDPAAYRDPAELQAALADDPLQRTHQRLLQRGAGAAQLDAVATAARDEISRALASAAAAPWPEAQAAFEQVQDQGAGQWL